MPFSDGQPISIPDVVQTTIALDQWRELMEKLEAESALESHTKPDGETSGSMPAALAAHYQALWQNVVWLASKWDAFKSLYGDQGNIDLLNETAPVFFGDLQRSQQREVLMRLCQVTDPPRSGGKPTLSIRRLPDLIDNSTLATRVKGLVDAAGNATAFAREWRNRLGAHNELPASVTGQPVAPFPHADWKSFDDAVASITAVMNAVSLHYCDSSTLYDGAEDLPGGVGALLHFLRLGRDAGERGSIRPEGR